MTEEELDLAYKKALWQIEHSFEPAKRASPISVLPKSSVFYLEAGRKDAAVTM